MLDTKLKNNKRVRKIAIVGIILLVTIVNLFFFPSIGDAAVKEYEEKIENMREVDTSVMRALYQGALVLYYEQAMQQADTVLTPADFFVQLDEIESQSVRLSVQESFANIYRQLEHEFENYRYKLDYFATNGEVVETNTAEKLEHVLKAKQEDLENITSNYQNLWVMQFDKLGQLHIEVLTSEDISPSTLIKSMKQAEKDWGIEKYIYNYTEIENPNQYVNKVTDFTVVFGVSKEQAENFHLYGDWYNTSDIKFYVEENATVCFLLSVVVLAVTAFLMNSPKVWTDLSLKRQGKRFLFEPAVLGVCMMGVWQELYCDRIYQVNHRELARFDQLLVSFHSTIFQYGDILVLTFFVFSIIYTICAAFCPVFVLGIKGYIKEYSLLYQIFPKIKKYWERFKQEIEQVDLSDETRKTILKLVVGNFVVLSLITCLWFFGILGLVIYSVILFFVADHFYTKVQNDYHRLLEATNRIAEGDLDTVITEEIGIFEPMKAELTKIRTGFKKAVEEEVKSQRMKTELITNVSHDLKTPLTAITTYVELLKKDDITDEERKEYIDTLERKSLRLKVLIEDLFEVSKANSENITLNLMKVDLVKLMKQVAVEHSEKYEEAAINLCWSVPKEKVELMLDGQKTYRIFENLFVNIQKYAMRGSRVYIEVVEADNQVKVVMKNMSAAPLNIAAQELTERFVRGDASRNTEGSGLGLAIAKSFTEAQKGSFEVVVDGDLFKTTIVWKK